MLLNVMIVWCNRYFCVLWCVMQLCITHIFVAGVQAVIVVAEGASQFDEIIELSSRCVCLTDLCCSYLQSHQMNMCIVVWLESLLFD